MNSPSRQDPSTGADVDLRHADPVDERSAFRRISQLLRRIWATPPSEVGVGAAELPVPTPADLIPAPGRSDEPVPAGDRQPEQESPAEPPRPAGLPRFESRTLWMPKRGNAEKEWEDGFAFDAAAGVVAVADGAGDGIFSKLWAELLLNSYVACPVPLEDPDAVGAWIACCRREWVTRVDYPRQRWSVQLRLDQSCGAATFLGIQIDEIPDAAGDVPWSAGAVGDVCLFHVRNNHAIAWFPIASSADFGTTPTIFQSKPMRPMPVGVITRGKLRPGELLLVATDALAQRLLMDVEADTAPDWSRFWTIDQDAWRQEIESLRNCGAIVNDDCTLVVIRLTSTMPESFESQAPAETSPEETSGEADANTEEAPPAASDSLPIGKPAGPVLTEVPTDRANTLATERPADEPMPHSEDESLGSH